MPTFYSYFYFKEPVSGEVYIYIYIYIPHYFTTEGFFEAEVAIGSWHEWDLNPQPLNSVQTVYTRYEKEEIDHILGFLP